ncbi:MAG: LEA type 2 family protein [Chitinophagales bacterium]|nr:LEA type 2 family protein [Chitinophagales bacterium]
MQYRKLLLFIPFSLLFSCAPLKPLQYRSLNNFSFTAAGNTPQITFDLNLYNPNSLGAKLKDFNVDIEMNGIKLASAQLADVSYAKAQAEFAIPININTTAEQLAQLLPAGLKMFTSGDGIPVHLQGNLTVKKFILRKTFPFDVQEKVDLSKIRLGK